MFFFFKQKTAYEMRISDWSSDVCSSDLLPMQRSDFTELFAIMHGLPVTIRLLDPPLHEFLPKSDEEVAEVARAMAMEPAFLRRRVDALHEFNPMLGHRGCRLALSYPEIAEITHIRKSEVVGKRGPE